MNQIPWFERLNEFAEETGYTAPVLEEGFRRVWAHLTASNIKQLIENEAPTLLSRAPLEFWIDAQTPFSERQRLSPPLVSDQMLLVTASTVPSAAFQDALMPLILPMRVTLRPAHNLVRLMQALVEHVQQYAPALGERLSVVPADHDEAALKKLVEAHKLVNVSGSDNTIARYRALLAHGARLIEHGHRVSAVIFQKNEVESLTDAEIDALARDASLWDQTGCLSPKLIFAETTFESAQHLAERLIAALDRVGQIWPEASPDLTQLAQQTMTLRMRLFDGAAVFRAQTNHDAVIVNAPGAALEPVLLPRTLSVFCVDDARQSAHVVAPHGQCLCTRQPLAETDQQRFRADGYNYFCTLGQMQDPPLNWFHDSVGTLKPLLA